MVRRAGLFTQVRRWRLSRALRAFLLIFSFGMKPLIGALPFLNTCGWTFLRLLKHSKSRHFNLDTIVFCLWRTSIRSPMSFRIVCCCSFCSRRGCWQRMLSCFQVASPSTSVFALTALCYRSVSAGSIHICFRLCFFSAGSHAGRSERHIWIGKIYRYWGRRRNIIHSDLWDFCQLPIGDRASFRNGSGWWLMSATRPWQQRGFFLICPCSFLKNSTHFSDSAAVCACICRENPIHTKVGSLPDFVWGVFPFDMTIITWWCGEVIKPLVKFTFFPGKRVYRAYYRGWWE